ncbi:HlyC/CorC family transporter [Dermacoccus sp. 147Ba]|uniref:hemolysin family protein n=1 Tax=Dermacoccus sp. 147Ba TaxID=2510111 RepID=UPI00101CEE3E|nr:hemolysin family protein [Dermacoccus sp. 147Ba]RYI21971.1 HlyC/CorC family transporter [Dermacoccus sp. 147Ba]
MTIVLIAALVSVVLGFGFALVESAVSRMTRLRVASLAEDGHAAAPALGAVVERHSTALMVLTFTRVGAEMTAAVLVTVAATRIFDDFWPALITAVAVMAVVSFVLVGVSPRTLGHQHADAVALAASRPLLVALKVLSPLARMLVALGNAVTPGEGYREGPFDSEAELREFVDLAEDSDLIEADERRMIHSVFELGDTIVREVMVPRTDMIVIDGHKSLRQAMNLFVRSGFSRVPVVGENTDDIVGLLYFKDVVRRHLTGEAEEIRISEVMRDMAFVPESKPVDALLKEMQRDRVHFAIVVDEYGGTAGLVTMEDIVEEIVGEIDDEYDRVTPGVEDLGDGRTRVPARMSIDDLGELFGVTIEEDDIDTVGGLLAKIDGRMPLPGATGEIAGLRLTAEKMAGRRHQLATLVVERVGDEDPAERGDEHAANSGAEEMV